MSFGSYRSFSGVLLPLSTDAAKSIQRVLSKVQAELQEIYKELIDSGELEEPPEITEDQIWQEKTTLLSQAVFTFWAVSLMPSSAPLPMMNNTDGDRIVLTRFRFPLKGNRREISKALKKYPILSSENSESWMWLEEDKTGATVFGQIDLVSDGLTLHTNSVERGEKGVALITEACGDLVGEPIGVHENLEDLMRASSGSSNQAAPVPDSPELQAMLGEHMEKHYRETLDEPIPMLNNQTPRECAAIPSQRHMVIEWLKYLENMEGRNPNGAYDFSWIWEELGLQRDVETQEE